MPFSVVFFFQRVSDFCITRKLVISSYNPWQILQQKSVRCAKNNENISAYVTHNQINTVLIYNPKRVEQITEILNLHLWWADPLTETGI